jgi:cell division protein ZapD
MQEAYITFEQPLNEYVRVCLRLENLFERVTQNIDIDGLWNCRLALEGMLEALNVVDRPDLKSKLTKALSQHASALTQLEEKPNVDHAKLHEILTDLDNLIDGLYKTPDKMGQELRNNAFLNSIRQHMANPGGACAFSTPAYHIWLKQPYEVRNRNLHNWFAEFNQLQTAVKLLLQLTRGSSLPQTVVAVEGFFHQPLDPKLAYHLVRVATTTERKVFPEISVGKHRLSVRFMELDILDKALQTTRSIEFKLTCCLPLLGVV